MSLLDVNENKMSGMGSAQGRVLIILHKADASDSKGGKTELEDGTDLSARCLLPRKILFSLPGCPC